MKGTGRQEVDGDYESGSTRTPDSVTHSSAHGFGALRRPPPPAPAPGVNPGQQRRDSGTVPRGVSGWRRPVARSSHGSGRRRGGHRTTAVRECVSRSHCLPLRERNTGASGCSRAWPAPQGGALSPSLPPPSVPPASLYPSAPPSLPPSLRPTNCSEYQPGAKRAGGEGGAVVGAQGHG